VCERRMDVLGVRCGCDFIVCVRVCECQCLLVMVCVRRHVCEE